MILREDGAMRPERATLIIDLQYGSTGKGLVAGKLAESGFFTAAVTSWGPNAGHTYIDSKGRKIVATMLANSAPWVEEVFIGPGSYINAEALIDEYMALLQVYGYGPEVWIHPHAAVVLPHHREAEGAFVRIGSTMKGTAEAAIERMRRDPNGGNVAMHFPETFSAGVPIRICKTPTEYADRIAKHSKTLLFEGAQGFGLSMYHGHYPYTTSRDVSVCQIVADSGMPPGDLAGVDVVGTARTYPIRVANRYDAEGNMIGTSGPCYDDQREIVWADLGLQPELTTVTKLPRRIFTWSKKQFALAARYNDPDYIFLNFCNYLMLPGNTLFPRLGSPREAVYYFMMTEMGMDPDKFRGSLITGFGPGHDDVQPFDALFNVKRNAA